jgi:hypothetical protein
MVLREIMVMLYADRAMHVIIEGSTPASRCICQ